MTAVVALGSLIAAAVLWFVSDLASWVYWAIVAGLTIQVGVIATLSYSWPRLEYSRTSYRVGSEGIEIKRGVVWRHVISVPRRRIQNTDVTQGPIQRRFGLASLVVHTAGTHEYEVTLTGVAYATALEIRDSLLENGSDDAARPRR